MGLILSSLEQGLIFAVLAMGVHITYKILKIADMSVEASFPFGALVSALLIGQGVNPLLATLAALVAGFIPGLIAGLISIKVKVDSLLAGILTMTMFYSINLKVNGRPNVPMSGSASIYDLIKTGNSFLDKIIVLVVVVLMIKLVLDWFMTTKAGYMVFTTGDNKDLVGTLGEDPDKYKLIGLVMANALVALSGSLFAQSIKFADTQMGVGTLVISLASLIIGDTLFRKTKFKGTTKAIIGALIYKLIGGLALELGLEANDLKMINAFIVIAFLLYNNSMGKVKELISKRGGNNA